MWRPADTVETAVAWSVALSNRTKPTALALSRQNLQHLSAAAPKRVLGDISRGAYVLSEPADVGIKKKPQAVIIATGSEVQLALKAQRLLADKKIAVRVVSMPSTTTFDREDAKYKAACCPLACPRGRGNGRPTAGGNTAAPPWWASTPTVSRPRARAVQALRLHRRKRGRHGAGRHRRGTPEARQEGPLTLLLPAVPRCQRVRGGRFLISTLQPWRDYKL